MQLTIPRRQVQSLEMSKPLANPYLILHKRDNVAIALRDLSPGEILETGAVTPPTASRVDTPVISPVPKLHKVSLEDIKEGDPVFKYGTIIGYATDDIAAGDLVHSHNLSMGALLQKDLSGSRSTGAADDVKSVPAPKESGAEVDRWFLGFQNESGRAGTRNYVLIASTVDCSAKAVELATEELNKRRERYARRYANVDGIVGLTHNSGCGLVSMSPGHVRQTITMRNLIDHPNVGASVVVQLGCEKSQAKTIFQGSRIVPLRGFESPGAHGDSIPIITIQENAGTWDTVDQIVAFVEKELLPRADRRRRRLIPASDLIMAAQCGGSDAASGITVNPAIGIASDLLVACGGTPFISETSETFGAEHILVDRAIDKSVADSYLEHVRRYVEYLKRGDGTPQHNLAVGNIAGGLTTIAEKSLGAVAKAGSTPLRWVKDYGERIDGRGLGFMNGPAFDPPSATGQTAGGAQVGVFSTGAGSCYGGILTPWVKVVSNSDTYERLIDMEIDAGRILEGSATIDEVGREIFETVLAVASGAKTYSEKIGYAVVNIWDSGVVT